MTSVAPAPLGRRIRFSTPATIAGGAIIPPPFEPDTQMGAKLPGWWSARAPDSIIRNGANEISRWTSLIGGYHADHYATHGGPKPIYEAAGWPINDCAAVRFPPASGGALTGSILQCTNFPRRDGVTTVVYLVAQRLDGELVSAAGSGFRSIVAIEPPLLAGANRPPVSIGCVDGGQDAAETYLVAGGYTGPNAGLLTGNAIIAGVDNNDCFTAAAPFAANGTVSLSVDGGATASSTYAYGGNQAANQLSIGGLPNTNYDSQPCRIMELLIVTDPTPEQHAKLVAWCNWVSGRQSALPASSAYLLDGPRNA